MGETPTFRPEEGNAPENKNYFNFSSVETVAENLKNGVRIQVKVLRTSGEIETGWEIIDLHPSGIVRVKKPSQKEGEKNIYKDIPLAELAKWQN